LPHHSLALSADPEAAARAPGGLPRDAHDHPDSLLARNAALDAPRLQRTPKHLATDVGINMTSAWIDCVMPNPGRRGCG
jgi:hypothetical protein